MNNIFKLHSIKLICGKNRNIYIKTNKKTSKQSKTEFIKYKGEYIKLNNFIKEHNKNNKKKGISHGKKNVIIINNIDDIKDKKIRNLFKKTFKKNAKIYIYTEKKLSRGGGAFKDDVSRNHDIVAPRNFDAIPDPIVRSSRSHSRFDDLIPFQLKIDYNNKYDDIIKEILEIGKTTLFEKINNLEYTIVVEGITFVIRPFIDFAPYKKIFLYFYINTIQFNNHEIKRWIKLPIHLSLFLNDMIERFNTHPPDSPVIKCLTTGHFHITSDDKIGNYNISTLLESSKFDRRTSATVSTSTHTYLIAGNLQQAEKIFKTHRKEIFTDWFYDKTTETETRDIKSSLFIPSNNKWVLIKDENINTIILSSKEKNQIYLCFDKLQYIISNILYILYKEEVSNVNLNESSIVMIDKYQSNSHERVKPADYLTYTIPTYPTNINIRYFDRDRPKRQGLIYEKDLKNANVNRGHCPGTDGHSAHSARSRSHSHHPPPAPPPAHSHHLPVRRRSREREEIISHEHHVPVRRRSREREEIISHEHHLPVRRRSREREEIISHEHHLPVRRRRSREREEFISHEHHVPVRRRRSREREEFISHEHHVPVRRRRSRDR